MRATHALFLAGAAHAAIQGFNYGATLTTGAAKVQNDFEAEFKRAQTLQGTSGWSSARLYTMIQGGTANTPTSAIQAAINTKTGLLLGLWGSAGQDSFNNEVAALKSAIAQYGSAFTDLIQGISVGSEDLYRISPTGIDNKSGAGADPSVIVNYIKQVRDAISGTPASGKSIGHVDTWTAWVNGSNSAVVDNVDWLGFDGYPYFQTVNANSIDNAKNLFWTSYNATVGAAKGKPVWVTETGWPVSGPQSNQAEASIANAQRYWDEVGCALFGQTNTWWYTVQDAAPQTPSPSFGIVGSDLNSAPLYNLTCPNIASSSNSSSGSSASGSASASGSSVPGSVAPGPSNTFLPPSSANATMAIATTITVTTMLPLESCAANCAAPQSAPASAPFVSVSTSPASAPAAPGSSAPPASSGAAPSKPASASSAPASTGSGCPTNLKGEYQYPHLIVPVDSSKPSTAAGTSYNGSLSSTVSTIFNFDIPQSYSGKTCSLVFLFPRLDQLETSSYSFNGKGGINVAQLSQPATEQTSYSSIPSASNANLGSVSGLSAPSGYVISTGPCAAGQRLAYQFSATGGLELNFFEDWNPSPLGAFITTC